MSETPLGKTEAADGSVERAAGLTAFQRVQLARHNDRPYTLDFVEMPIEGGVMVRVRPHGALRVRGSRELESALRAHGCHVEWMNVTLA